MSLTKPPLNLFHVAGYYRGGPKLISSFFTFYEREKKMTEEELAAAFADRAKAEFAKKGSPDAIPVLERIYHHFDMPSPPRLPDTDTRPLKTWDVKAGIVVHDVKYSNTLHEQFDWPEEPKGAVLDKLIFYMAACDVAGRGDDPGYANEAEISNIRVTPGTKAPASS